MRRQKETGHRAFIVITGGLHDSAPSAWSRANVSSVTPLTRFRLASSTNGGHRLEGMRPLTRQLLTVVAPADKAFATLDVPPSASISESEVMTEKISTFCGCVNIHASAIALGRGRTHSLTMLMKPFEAIGRRLALLRAVLDVSQAEMCRQIKCSTTRWNNYELGERRITLPIAIKLADEYGASLDWIYRGARDGLPLDLRTKLNKAA